MLVVLRHAQSEWNEEPRRCQGQRDVPLSTAGIETARAHGARLSVPDAVYSSHLRRAVQTAEILLRASAEAACAAPPPIALDQRLAEACCGDWEGLLHSEVMLRWPAEWNALGRDEPGFRFPGGESLEEVAARFAQALAEIDACHAGQTALVVTHGGPVRLYLIGRLGPAAAAPGAAPGNLGGFVLEAGEVRSVFPGAGPSCRLGGRA